MKKKIAGIIILLIALACAVAGIMTALFGGKTMDGLILIGLAALLSALNKKYMGFGAK